MAASTTIAKFSEEIKKNMFKDQALNDALTAEVKNTHLKVMFNGRQWAVGSKVFDITAQKMSGFKSFCKRVLHFFKSWTPQYRKRFKLAVQHMAEAKLAATTKANTLMMANEQFNSINTQLKKDMGTIRQLEDKAAEIEKMLDVTEPETHATITKMVHLQAKVKKIEIAFNYDPPKYILNDLQNDKLALAKLEDEVNATILERKAYREKRTSHREQAKKIRKNLEARFLNLETKAHTDEADLNAHLEKAVSVIENIPAHLRVLIKSDNLAKREHLKMADN